MEPSLMEMRRMTAEERVAKLMEVAATLDLATNEELSYLLTSTAEHVGDLRLQVTQLEADARKTLERRNNAGAKPGPDGLTTLQAVDVIRDAADWLSNQDNAALRAHNLERAADRLECLADNLTDNEYERDALGRRLLDLSSALNRIQIAAMYLQVACNPQERMPEIEVARGRS
jgi:hypothetical protein